MACALILYVAFPTRTYYWDGVLFSLNIESVARGDASAAMLIHPNHLLFSGFGYLLYRGAAACGLAMRAIAVLQVFDMLASAAAAGLVYAIAKRVTQSAGAALACGVLFAFGATWWKFSTDADAYIPTVLLLLLTIWFAIQQPPRLVAAGACHTAAMLFHQLAIFTYAAIVTAILLDRRRSPGKRVSICAAYVCGTSLCVGAAYWICYLQADHAAYPTLRRFIASYASDSGFTRSFAELFTMYLASYGKLFAGGKLSLIREFFSPLTVTAFVVCAAALGFSVRQWRAVAKPEQADRRALAILWAWLIPCAIFLALWDPGSAFHKLFAWPAIALLIGAYAASRRERPWIGLAIGLAAWNFGAYIYPHAHASADPVLTLARRMDGEMPKNATVYYAAFSPDDWYLDYFAPGRKWVRLAGAPAKEPFCAETTALVALAPTEQPAARWELVNSQHNIRVECFSGAR
ncbi:MAG: glycosyltransferase family 39 protein [Acidobacteriaceae bacterium]|nr:glycosyltransferase family 39 protein [Acidobacteriaceae bacterium]